MSTELTFPSPNLGVNPSTRHCLIYFLTGNPGLIDYYAPFLTHLRSLLNDIEVRRKHKVAFHLYGRDLAGFNDADHAAPFNATSNPPHDVESQIQHAFRHIIAANHIPTTITSPDGGKVQRGGQPFDEVVLMGHSLGTYLALEIFHRHLHDPDIAPGLNLKSGVLLFATIAHLAKSRKGVQLDLIRRTPVLSTHVHTIARSLLWLLPVAFIRWFTATVLSMAPHAAATTTRFLTSRDGIYQALYLGMDEMKVISEETWAEELWEIADEAVAHAHEVPKFFILFGKDDHWVPNQHRDKFIEEREKHSAREDAPKTKRGRTRIVIDEEGLPHDFCINHSETVANKVGVWIDEIAEHP
ncbi:hypothetical protein M406DRAFT_32811 [Cryphonectria parasitica EP155]|uniref:Lipid droplet-associated hydrolase n=1 Tax=Cryphonectria parasitica (strain ATCC 38755 / EP155) TaxID=660469 RepID=A0A9P5CTZ9_CRYP1|nr:uncharacterized protein M406DRAFT_32811 [Cryphonectria parasitica EP155]KAF3771169.1 hypothetical protein M406DRAFT_32811 [Cryphonectria parasitica EP155]